MTQKNKKVRINLGSGKDIMKGYQNVDKFSHKGVNIIHDLNIYPYPFRDGSVDEIKVFHILEHVEDYERTLLELKRILKVGGLLHIKVPHYSMPCAKSEFHRRFFWWGSLTSERVMGDTTSLESQEYNWYEIKSKKLNFQKEPFFWNYLIEFIMNLKYMPQIFEHTILSSFFPAYEIEMKVVKKK